MGTRTCLDILLLSRTMKRKEFLINNNSDKNKTPETLYTLEACFFSGM